MKIPESARAVINSAALAHLVTLNRDGSPQVTIVWARMDGDDVIAGHLYALQKVRNMRNDARVAVSFESGTQSQMGLDEYLVVYGQAQIEEGGAPELLQELAYTYIGPGVKFPTLENPPPGYITRIKVERISGVGPWTSRDV